MRKFFKILEKLSEQETWYCFQSQSNQYFNINVVTPKGTKEDFSAETIDEMEKWLVIRWGHLLEKPTLPLPPGFLIQDNK